MATNYRKKKQQAFYFRVTANFILFCLVAAPLQFHMGWYSNLISSNSSPDWLEKLLRSGPMYFYSLILCLEGNLRLEHYPRLLFGDRRIYFLRLLLIIPIAIFALQYFATDLYRNTTTMLPFWEQGIQLGAGVFSCILSILVNHVVANQEMKRIK